MSYYHDLDDVAMHVTTRNNLFGVLLKQRNAIKVALCHYESIRLIGSFPLKRFQILWALQSASNYLICTSLILILTIEMIILSTYLINVIFIQKIHHERGGTK